MLYQKICFVGLSVYATLSRTVFGSIYVEYADKPQNNQGSCTNASEYDRCEFHCDSKDAKLLYNCHRAGICDVYCEAKKCLSTGGINATNVKQLNVYGTGQQCLLTGTVYLPSNGSANITALPGADTPFEETIINAHAYTNDIYIDCYASGNCLNMEVNAQTAQSLYINAEGDGNAYDGKDANNANIVHCPTSHGSECTIDASNSGILEAVTVNANNTSLYINANGGIVSKTTINVENGPCNINIGNSGVLDSSSLNIINTLCTINGTNGGSLNNVDIVTLNGYPHDVVFEDIVDIKATLTCPNIDGGEVKDKNILDESKNKCFNSRAPTISPSTSPTSQTNSPSFSPSFNPSFSTYTPSFNPSSAPTALPTFSPSETTLSPSESPTFYPSDSPTHHPSFTPTTFSPSELPTYHPSESPTFVPSKSPTTSIPTAVPSIYPTVFPTDSPTISPTSVPIHAYATNAPIKSPTEAPGAVTTTNDAIVSTHETPETSEEAPNEEESQGVVIPQNLLYVFIFTTAFLFICVLLCGLLHVLRRITANGKKAKRLGSHPADKPHHVQPIEEGGEKPLTVPMQAIGPEQKEVNAVDINDAPGFETDVKNIQTLNDVLLDDVVDDIADSVDGVEVDHVTRGYDDDGDVTQRNNVNENLAGEGDTDDDDEQVDNDDNVIMAGVTMGGLDDDEFEICSDTESTNGEDDRDSPVGDSTPKNQKTIM